MSGRTTWSDEQVCAEVTAIAITLGHFPSSTELRGIGKNDLACAMTKRGGYLLWSERIGIQRQHSDSDTGWDGERMFIDLATARGLSAVRSDEVKAPFDVLVGSCLRVDVKAAKFASYARKDGGAASSGWFYRLGKHCQSDIVALVRLDKKDAYLIPWYLVPTSNVTITPTGITYQPFYNNWEVVSQMLAVRASERMRLAALMPLRE